MDKGLVTILTELSPYLSFLSRSYGFNAGNSSVFVELDNPFKAIKLPSSGEDVGILMCQLLNAGLSLFPQMLGTVPNFLRDRLEFVSTNEACILDRCRLIGVSSYNCPSRSDLGSRQPSLQRFFQLWRILRWCSTKEHDFG